MDTPHASTATTAFPRVISKRRPKRERACFPDAMSPYFSGLVVDDLPQLLAESYGLRYQIYCHKRRFLRAEDYPDQVEIDVFDRHSVHVGVVNTKGAVVGTARLVEPGGAGLPLFEHCWLFPDEKPLQDPTRRVVEVSRLSVSQEYNRRAGDAGAIVLALYKALYQASKRRGFTHWVVATEKSLQRLVTRYGFPFRAIGPESDYYGLVSPYLMDLQAFDGVIVSGRNPLLREFLIGLEPEFRPAEDTARVADTREAHRPHKPRAPPRDRRRGGNRSTHASTKAGEDRLMKAFRRAVADMPWYRTLLDEHGVHPDQVMDVDSFSTLCPPLTQTNTFGRFPLDQLAAMTAIADLASVLTSSGHGGRFSFGLQTRTQAAASGSVIDQALDAAFQINTRSTLAINCLPMGVGFSSDRMTVATTSVREDIAVALIEAFGGNYDQILLVADPVFMKRLLDYAAAEGTDWSRFHVHVVLGEEVFGEHFRRYVATCLGLDHDHPEHGYIASSFGVGELGLHLCYETPATIALRRAASSDPELARELLGVGSARTAVPMIFSFNAHRTFIEVAAPDCTGYGRLTISMLDKELPVPLLRYQTGDRVRLLDADAVASALRGRGIAVPRELPASLLALEGRDRETLPNGSHVGVYKDALYADHLVARHITGAFRVIFSGTTCTMHVQLTPPQVSAEALTTRLLEAIPAEVRPARLVFWPYNRFPFGMTVDYERKFSYYVPGEDDLPAADTTR